MAQAHEGALPQPTRSDAFIDPRLAISGKLYTAIGVDPKHDSLAEWSKALAQGASPQGRGFEAHSCQLSAAKLCGRVPDH